MKRIRNITVLIFVIVILTMCEKSVETAPIPIYSAPVPPYLELEKNIRAKYDSRAVFTWDQYMKLLLELSGKKFLVLPLNEMRKTFDDSKVVVGLRHDIDMNPFKALEMAKIESGFGIRATYFVLSTSDYYGLIYRRGITLRSAGIGALIKEIYRTGAEIGIHNDLLTVMIEYGGDPYIFNQDDLLFYKTLGIPVYGTSAHGSVIAKATVPNFQIFSDFASRDSVTYHDARFPIGKKSLKEYGFEYEAYFINYNLYYSESGGKWNDPAGLAGIIEKLKSSVPGDRIEILTHPDWWGK